MNLPRARLARTIGAIRMTSVLFRNHDAYVRAAVGLALRDWGDYMRAIPARIFLLCGDAVRWR